jgi:hypothetical protein
MWFGDRAGMLPSELSLESRDHDRRLVRLEIIIEFAKNQLRLTESQEGRSRLLSR